MSNKEISDKDVVNENDIETLKESIEEAYRFYDYDLDYNPFSMGIAKIVEHILAEREQDKNRIQELEAKKWNDLDNTNFENYIEEIVKERTKDYISKQKIEDVIESKIIDISGFECIALEDLQELLEGEE